MVTVTIIEHPSRRQYEIVLFESEDDKPYTNILRQLRLPEPTKIVRSGKEITETTVCRLEPGDKLYVILDNAPKVGDKPAILIGGSGAAAGNKMIVQFMNAVPEIRGSIASPNSSLLVTAFRCLLQQLSLGPGTVTAWGIDKAWNRTRWSDEEERKFLPGDIPFSPVQIQATWHVFFFHVCSGLRTSKTENLSILEQYFTGHFRPTGIDGPGRTFHYLTCPVKKDTGSLEMALKKHGDSIARLPKYLVIHLERFHAESGIKRCMRPVSISGILDVAGYCTEELQEQLNPSRTKLLKALRNPGLNSMISREGTEASGIYKLMAVVTNDSRASEPSECLTGKWSSFVSQDALSPGSQGRVDNKSSWWKFVDNHVSEVNADAMHRFLGNSKQVLVTSVKPLANILCRPMRRSSDIRWNR
ncbi:hypothetical protein MMC30_007343 [Trapelia coarctata]|nr:hypothetical protein [Trapelia coarctata]